jgi:hypothetical protein
MSLKRVTIKRQTKDKQIEWLTTRIQVVEEDRQRFALASNELAIQLEEKAKELSELSGRLNSAELLNMSYLKQNNEIRHVNQQLINGILTAVAVMGKSNGVRL